MAREIRRLVFCLSALPVFFGLVPEAIAQNPIIMHDRDGDDRLSRREFPGPPPVFDRLDSDGDGFLTHQEFRQGRRNRGDRGPSRQRRRGKPSPPPELARPASPAWRYLDTHTHLHPIGLDVALRGSGGFANQGGGDGPPDMAANLREAAERLVTRMDAYGLQKALVVVVPSTRQSPEEDYAGMRDAVRSQPGRLFLMAGGATLGSVLLSTAPDAVSDSDAEEFVSRAEKLIAEGARGFGEMISYHLCMTQRHSFKYAPADHPLFLRLADVAAKSDVPIGLHMEAIEHPGPMPENLRRACDKNPEQLTATIPGLEALLAHNRGARIVWQHIGWDNVGQMTPRLLDRLLRRHENLFLSLRVERRTHQVGGGGRMPNRIVDTEGAIHPDWLKLIDEHQDRVMVGSDEFVGPSGKEPGGAASFADTWAMVSRLPPVIARKIGRSNAARIYRLQ